MITNINIVFIFIYLKNILLQLNYFLKIINNMYKIILILFFQIRIPSLQQKAKYAKIINK